MSAVDVYRRKLDVGWSVLASAASLHETPQALPETGWHGMVQLATVSAWARAEKPALNELISGGDAEAHDWWYRLRFDGDAASARDAVLELDGLATLAQVWLNDERLLVSENMFAAHRCAVDGRLRAAGNELVICFRSLTAALSKRRPRPAWRVPMIEQQQLRWYRTSLLGRTPGWSPPTPVIGPWRDIWLTKASGAHVEAVDLRVRVVAGIGLLDLSFSMGAPAQPSRVDLILTRGEVRVVAQMTPDADGRWRGNATVEAVELWWPHTHGEPARYHLQVELREQVKTVHDIGHVGFRTVQVDARNDGFSVVVNGQAVFCRGACWMPADPVGWRPAAGDVRKTVERARDAGMNMLRVSGTTAYEGEEFFEACDALGVLVWQDLMFANMDYPGAEPSFAEAVQLEVSAQLRGWQGRPSLALVCGNSEVSQQAAMWGASRSAWNPSLFFETLPSLVADILPAVPYWPSSAWGGAFPHQPDSGTSSYYGVGAYLRPPSDARRSRVRFASECLAFSNIPSAQAIARMPGGEALRVTHAKWKERAPRDLTAGWDFEDVRDHYMAQLFDVEPSRLRYDDHERYLALGRATTGELMVSAFSEWRRAGSDCGGALVWFLRDLWAGAGWGLLDEAGAPKACFHALRRVLQPQAVLLTDEGSSGLVAHLVNERAEPLVAQLSLEAWRGETRVFHGKETFELAPRSVQAVPLASLLEHFSDLNHAYRFGPCAHDVVVVNLADANGVRVSQAHHFPSGMALTREGDLGFDAVSQRLADGRVELTLSARRFALGVHFEAPGYQPDDEFFHLSPGQVQRVVFCPDAAVRPWWGRVLALNATAGTAIRMAA